MGNWLLRAIAPDWLTCYPARPQDPEGRPPEEWIRRTDRRPLEEVARHL